MFENAAFGAGEVIIPLSQDMIRFMSKVNLRANGQAIIQVAGAVVGMAASHIGIALLPLTGGFMRK